MPQSRKPALFLSTSLHEMGMEIMQPAPLSLHIWLLRSLLIWSTADTDARAYSMPQHIPATVATDVFWPRTAVWSWLSRNSVVQYPHDPQDPAPRGSGGFSAYPTPQHVFHCTLQHGIW